ncbi:hypothetical protein GSI_09860 [Ganoderma sinense ZZ0214-1]|uniref:Uncharacterized protein n=1 Tax=Ganoderma sinense ZZ0214-1 TaxID=1077348 RepID=A0A2G8S2K7_9APHY|nr:hypothetical protein GSI_09860 [Ganoderma sinense ZZ0214-1]
MAQYLDELCLSPSVAHLRKLDLHVDIDFNQHDNVNDDEPFKGVNFTSDILAPLVRLSALTDISVDIFFRTSTITFVMGDEDLDSIASAWPDLARAKFSHTIENDDHPWGVRTPSFSAVVALAERCRKLESGEVALGNVDADELALVFDPDTSESFCEVLSLEDPKRLAAALRRLFPNLRSELDSEVVEVPALVQGKPGELGPSDSEVYRGWRHYMDTDVFRLLRALDEVDLDGSL